MSQLKEEVLDRLIELNPITLPNSMVEDEIKNLQEDDSSTNQRSTRYKRQRSQQDPVT